MIYSIYGYGKAKTGSAIGITIRAYQNKDKILFAQFLKDGSSSEIDFFKEKLYDRVTIESMGTNRFIRPNKKEVRDFIDHIKFLHRRDKFNLIVLDEILVALDYGYIELDEFELLLEKLGSADIYMTGRINNQTLRRKIVEYSDICTNAYCKAHVFNTTCPECLDEHPYYFDYCPKCGSKLEVSREAKKGRDF